MARTVVAISEPMAASEADTMASATSTSIEGEAGDAAPCGMGAPPRRQQAAHVTGRESKAW